MNVIVGAGAMGAALAVVHARAGLPTTLIGTKFDDAVIQACAAGRPHPALGMILDRSIECRPHADWDTVLFRAERIALAVSSDGLADVAAEAAAATPSDALWLVATKGWDGASLRTPTEILATALGDAERVVVLAGPALAPELVAGGPTSVVCGGLNSEVARRTAQVFRAAGVAASVTDDVVAAEIAAAYKNVTAIAVGMCEGLSEHLAESVFIHRFANARAAMFAEGLQDMNRLAAVKGGRMETILGLAGAGDLYVTCLGGRNGTFGRLLGSGQTPEQAQRTIGSTVEGVPNTHAALKIAARDGVELRAAPAVAAVLSGESSPEGAVAEALI